MKTRLQKLTVASLAIVALLAPSVSFAAVTRDVYAQDTADNSGAATCTQTSTASDGYLLVGVNEAGGSDTVSGVTLDGSPMTPLQHIGFTSGIGTTLLFGSPVTAGAHVIVESNTPGNYVWMNCIFYAGVSGIDTSSDVNAITLSSANELLAVFGYEDISPYGFSLWFNNSGFDVYDQTFGSSGLKTWSATYPNVSAALIPDGSPPPSPSGVVSPFAYISTTTLYTVVDNPTQDFFDAIIVFMVSFLGMVWLLRKH